MCSRLRQEQVKKSDKSNQPQAASVMRESALGQAASKPTGIVVVLKQGRKDQKERETKNTSPSTYSLLNMFSPSY